MTEQRIGGGVESIYCRQWPATQKWVHKPAWGMGGILRWLVSADIISFNSCVALQYFIKYWAELSPIWVTMNRICHYQHTSTFYWWNNSRPGWRRIYLHTTLHDYQGSKSGWIFFSFFPDHARHRIRKRTAFQNCTLRKGGPQEMPFSCCQNHSLESDSRMSSGRGSRGFTPLPCLSILMVLIKVSSVRHPPSPSPFHSIPLPLSPLSIGQTYQSVSSELCSSPWQLHVLVMLHKGPCFFRKGVAHYNTAYTSTLFLLQSFKTALFRYALNPVHTVLLAVPQLVQLVSFVKRSSDYLKYLFSTILLQLHLKQNIVNYPVFIKFNERIHKNWRH